MKFSISKQNLLKALSITQSIVEKKTTMPILTNLLLSVSDNKLTISSTDLEITAVSSTTAKVVTNGSTTVNARVFSEIIKELSEDREINITLNENERLEITSGKSKLRVIGVSAEEYPSLPGISISVTNTILASQLINMISKTLYATSYDETRFNLNGVCFECSNEKKKNSNLRLVSTDGHRLALIENHINGLDFVEKVIVPRKGLTELKRLLDNDADKEVRIGLQDGFFIVDTGSTKISMRLIDGEFPDYNNVIPSDPGELVIVDNVDELEQALRRVALMVSDKGKSVKLDFHKDRIRITSSSPELGDATEDLDCQYSGENLSLGFNAKYLLDMLGTINKDQSLVIELHGELGPGKFYAQNDESYIGIIMPMRLV